MRLASAYQFERLSYYKVRAYPECRFNESPSSKRCDSISLSFGSKYFRTLRVEIRQSYVYSRPRDVPVERIINVRGQRVHVCERSEGRTLLMPS